MKTGFAEATKMPRLGGDLPLAVTLGKHLQQYLHYTLFNADVDRRFIAYDTVISDDESIVMMMQFNTQTRDEFVVIYDMKTRRTTHVDLGHSTKTAKLDISPDNKMFLLSRGGFILVYRMASPEKPMDVQYVGEAAAFAADNLHMFVMKKNGIAKYRIGVAAAVTGRIEERGHQLLRVPGSTDIIVSSWRNTMKRMTADLQVLWSADVPKIVITRISPDGQHILAIVHGHGQRMCDAASGVFGDVHETNHTLANYGAAFISNDVFVVDEITGLVFFDLGMHVVKKYKIRDTIVTKLLASPRRGEVYVVSMHGHVTAVPVNVQVTYV